MALLVPSRWNVAILSIDPGRTTGICAGLFDLRQSTVAMAMRRARSKHVLWSWEIGGDHVEQSWELGRWYEDFHYHWHVEKPVIPDGNFHITMENFIPRQLEFDVISLQIIGGFESLIEPLLLKGMAKYVRQEPVERWADDEWLKRHKLWAKSVHERDARRHTARKLDKLLR